MIVSCRPNASKKSTDTVKIGSDSENREVKKISKKRGWFPFFKVLSSYPKTTLLDLTYLIKT